MSKISMKELKPLAYVRHVPQECLSRHELLDAAMGGEAEHYQYILTKHSYNELYINSRLENYKELSELACACLSRGCTEERGADGKTGYELFDEFEQLTNMEALYLLIDMEGALDMRTERVQEIKERYHPPEDAPEIDTDFLKRLYSVYFDECDSQKAALEAVFLYGYQCGCCQEVERLEA